MIDAPSLAPERYQHHMARWLINKIPDYFLPEIKREVQTLIRHMCRQGAEYGLSEARQLDFLYLFERTRRWSSGSQHSQTSVVLAPFLNGDFIRAVYSYTGSGMTDNVFHRYIISCHAPDWDPVPFDRELKLKDKQAKRTATKRKPSPSWTQSNNRTYFNRHLYWQQAGASLLKEELASSRFWREIVDPQKIEKHLFAAGDELVMLCQLERLL